MTPADIERAVTALRRAFPAVADEGVERFRRELGAPRMMMVAGTWEKDHDSYDPHAVALWFNGDIVADVEAFGVDGRHRWRVWSLQRGPGFHEPSDQGYAPTRSEAMRAAERALWLPECEVVNG